MKFIEKEEINVTIDAKSCSAELLMTSKFTITVLAVNTSRTEAKVNMKLN